MPDRELQPAPAATTSELDYEPLDLTEVNIQPTARTVEQNWILDIYSFFHSRAYSSRQLNFPSHTGDRLNAHLLLPDGEGPYPVVIVFPILEGNHVVSEALAKALVNRGFAVTRMERHELDLAETERIEAPSENFRSAVIDARRILDYVAQHPKVDAGRIAAAGVSTGGILAATLMGVDPRVRAGFFTMAGGDLAGILYDSTEKPVRIFRDRVLKERGLDSREAFIEAAHAYTVPVDPLTYAPGIPTENVLLISARFDRVVRPQYTETLWEAFGRPRWIRVPSGHYQIAPFFWYAANHGADHLERVFELDD